MEKDYNLLYRIRRKSQGNCVSCGKHPARKNGVICEWCCENHRHRSKVKRQQAIDQNLCYRCHQNPPTESYSTCEKCRVRDRLASKISTNRRREKLLAMGLCHCKEKRVLERNKKSCNECLKKSTDSAKKSRKKLVIQVYTHYSQGTPKCACCGESEINFLSIDHINGGGWKDITQNGTKSPVTFYSRLVKQGFPVGLQVLCMNCNFGKHRNGGVCPHTISK